MELTQTILQALADALITVSQNVWHYHAPPNTVPPYIVWMEDGDNDLMAGNSHAELCVTGSIHLFTKTENDPLYTSIPQALETAGAAWYLNSVQFEEETSLLHYEWYWELT